MQEHKLFQDILTNVQNPFERLKIEFDDKKENENIMNMILIIDYPIKQSSYNRIKSNNNQVTNIFMIDISFF